MILMMGFGFFSMQYNKEETRLKRTSTINDKWTIVLLEDYLKKGRNSYSAPVSILSEERLAIDAMAYFSFSLIDSVDKTNDMPTLIPGVVLYCRADMLAISAPRNPNVFDYKKYQERRGVTHQIMIKEYFFSGDIKNRAGLYFLKLRRSLLNVFSVYLKEDELAIASALVLGYKGELSAEIKDAYAGAGAMHVLAVSGLHVGLVYLFLSQLLKFMNRRRSTTILKFVLIIICIQLYAALTGFSPSVTRAAMMFSLIAIGKILLRNSSIYNIIFVSAFVMLLHNPQFLFDVSFQLSYVAVIGIIYFFPLFFELYTPKNRVDLFLWSLVCLSLSAQLSTFPLALFYFKLFPFWFLLTNIIIVPAATIILPGGFLLILAHYLNLGVFLAIPYEFFIHLTNSSIYWIEHLPPGKYIASLSLAQLFLVYLFLVLTAILVSYPKRSLFYLSFFSLLVVLSSIILRDYQSITGEGWCYFSDRSSLIEFHRNGESVLVGDSLLLSDHRKLNYLVSGFQFNNGSVEFRSYNMNEDVDHSFLRKQGNLMSFGSELIYLADGNEVVPSDIQVDYVILDYGAFNYEEILSNNQPKMVLLSVSFPNRQREKVIDYLEENDIDYWDLREKGAFVHEKKSISSFIDSTQ